MKKIINGKSYSTESAKQIAFYSSDLPVSDFAWCQETLYLKRTGEYFLHGEGGPMSNYAKNCEDGSIGYGEYIMPLTQKKLKLWKLLRDFDERSKSLDPYELAEIEFAFFED